MAALTRSTLLGVGVKNGCSCGVLPVADIFDTILIPTIAGYCGKEHHVFETAVGNLAV